MVYINKGEHDNPHELPSENSGGSLNIDNAVYTHTDFATKLPEEIEKLEYIYQHFQDCEKIHEIDPHIPTEQIVILYTLRSVMIVTILIVRLEMILHVPKLVILTIMITTHLTQDHSVHIHMIIYHNNLTH